jgi:23S rRNA pseudouridine2604 synthase
MLPTNDQSVSLNKFISQTGICSRREADEFIKLGRVLLNGQVAKTGNRVNPGDEVLLDGKPVIAKEPNVYIALNKPVGITCTTELKIKGNIIEFVNHPQRIFPIGRLDKPSEGLILLTNDGDIINKILRAGNGHDKEYVVKVDRPITDKFLFRMANGVQILDTVTLPCEIYQTGKHTFKIILKQGLNRQIRRMCEALGYEVTSLKRTRIMHIHLGELPIGKWRDLTADELDELNRRITTSDKTEQASKRMFGL